MEISTDFDEEIPRWDVALEALLRETCQRLGRPLTHGDFRQLATRYAIRFDDIMDTLFELAMAGEWEFRQADGEPVAVTPELVAGLHVKSRLEEDDLRTFRGSWRPLR